MVPLAAVILAVVTRIDGGRRRYLEHLVFSLHVHSAALLFLVASMVVMVWVPGSPAIAWLPVIPYVGALAYAALAIRRSYSLGTRSALLATAGGAILYSVVFLVAVSALLAAVIG